MVQNEANPGEEDDLRELLRLAFPNGAFCDCHKTTDFTPLTHADCVLLRQNLPYYDCPSVQELLPAVLDDLLDADDRDNNGEMVIYFLNPIPYEPPSNEEMDRWFAALSTHLSSEVIAEMRDLLTRPPPTAFAADSQAEGDTADLRKAKFACFTTEQDTAIFRWLLVASSWPEFDFVQSSLDQAIAYWSHRANQPGRRT